MASWLRRCWQAVRRFKGAGTAASPPVAEPDPPVTHAHSTPSALRPAHARAPGFARHRFAWEGHSHHYRLFVPDGPACPPPLVVMLHGCKQDAADFARGTGMNRLAQAHGCLVLYPEQTAKANRLRCWNWFDRAHQGHAGEPAMIAALARQVAQQHGADPQRIYIAGLSAGGAMAAVVAALYPAQFAALGVHSGLPAGAASNLISAFAAMRRGSPHARALAGPHAAPMPTLVFHGSADDTVHPDNGAQLAEQALAGLQAAGLALTCVESDQAPPGQRPARVSRWLDAQGRSHLERWTVHTGPHAWSGGDPAGSFTDARGPSASAALLDFFLQHRRPA